jgi:GT2 family glycosyltransferase
VLVVDNAGSPPALATLQALDDSRVHVSRCETNTGPAGGHARGLEAFLRSDQSFAWILDDDVLPEPDVLGHLLAATEDGTRVACPRQVDAEGHEENYPGWYGYLFPRAVVERIGLPRADLVWWIEDTEYLTHRVAAAGIPVARAQDALVVHLGGRPGRRAPWQVYYETRNSVYYRLYLQRCRHPLKLLRTLARVLGSVVLREPDKAKRLRLYARGVFDGSFGRLGLRVPLEAAEVEPA